MNQSRLFIAILSLLAIFLSGWSILSLNNNNSAPTSISDPNQTDVYMKNIVATVYNKEGNVALEISTPSMTHYQLNDVSQLIAPRVTIYRESSQPWLIDAKFAKTEKGLEQIIFWNKVNIHHLADEDNPDTSLLTESLTILPDQKIAKTDLPILFQQPDTKINAVGMLAKLDDGTINLLSETKGVYVPAT
jgi:lipopolysaccharide export system protein LptC